VAECFSFLDIDAYFALRWTSRRQQKIFALKASLPHAFELTNASPFNVSTLRSLFALARPHTHTHTRYAQGYRSDDFIVPSLTAANNRVRHLACELSTDLCRRFGTVPARVGDIERGANLGLHTTPMRFCQSYLRCVPLSCANR
jgi:hypothetical protein